MPPRIAVTVEQFWHRVPGGTARATRGVLDGLVAAGNLDLVGIAAHHPRTAVASQRLPIPVRCFPLPRPLLYEAWHRLGWFEVSRLVGPVDLIWASAMVVPPASVPTVVTVNDIDFLHHPERLSGRGRTFFPRAWDATCERASIIVCPSEFVAADVAEHGFDSERIRVVPLGVEVRDIDDDTVAEVVARLGLPDRFALWVGTIEPRKNLGRIVDALMTIDDLPLVVVGPDGWNVDDVDLLQPLGQRAHRLGQVSDPDLEALYRAATVVLLPSLAEGFGLPVLEAMAQGTPVVTSRGTATEEVAGGAAVLVDPHQADAIAAGIRKIVDDPALAEELSVAGRRRATELSWEASAVGYANVFAEVGR